MHLTIHRGTQEIGGNCVEIKSGGKSILIDLGSPLNAETNSPEYLPNIPGLLADDGSISAIIISHPHSDHFGLLKHIDRKIPIIIGKAARSIINAAAPFMYDGFTISECTEYLENNRVIEIGAFRITPYLIDHSAYDSYSLLIEAEGKKIFYTGDFRTNGRKYYSTLNTFANLPNNIDILITEGTNFGRTNTNKLTTEVDIEKAMLDEFKRCKGLAAVQISAQNIDRVVSVFKASKDSGRTMLIDLYTAEVLKATMNKNIPQSDWGKVALIIPQRQSVQIKNKRWFDKLNSHSVNRIYFDTTVQVNPQNYVLLYRSIYDNDLEKYGLFRDMSFIYSMWEGYWSEDSTIAKLLAKNGIARTTIHCSGHASPDVLIDTINKIAAKHIIPIHTLSSAEFFGTFPNILHCKDGIAVEV